MIGDASTAKNVADQLLLEGIYVIAFSYPVVPKDTARIRFQISAAHEKADLEVAVSALENLQPSIINGS
jgi:glycine C-acetyltransferase